MSVFNRDMNLMARGNPGVAERVLGAPALDRDPMPASPVERLMKQAQTAIEQAMHDDDSIEAAIAVDDAMSFLRRAQELIREEMQ
jgi:hypothetical protein